MAVGDGAARTTAARAGRAATTKQPSDRKRARPIAAPASPAVAAEKPAHRRAKRPPRKALHAVRREEIAELLAELGKVHGQFQALQKRALATSKRRDATSAQAAFAARVLRDGVQRRQLELTPLHRLVAEYSFFDTRAGSPLHEFIHLPKEPAGRRAVLLALRDSILRHGERFLRARLAWVDPRRIVRDQFCFEAPDGDFCLSYVNTVQFEGAATVKGVFDAVHQFLSNIEIVLSERIGSVTIREDDQHGDAGFSQNRLVSFTPRRDLVIESNNAVFSRFDEPKDVPGRRHGYGIAVLDFCDEDELYPYQPDKRARRDGNAIVEVTSWPQRTRDGGEDEKHVVCIVHWLNMHLHRPACELPQGGWQELCEVSERWVRTLQFALHEIYVP